MGLTKIAITRPIFIFMLIVLSVLMGIFALQRMRVEQDPEVQFGVITISTPYPGAGPEEVSELVSRPIEESVSGVNGLREVSSSSQEGVSVVVALFEIGTNMDTALNDLRSKVDAVVGDLPRDIIQPSVSKVDSTSEPVITMTVSSTSLNAQQVRDLVDDQIRDRFARIKGVSNVTVRGGDEREIQVQLKLDRLLSYGIGAVDVQRALAAASFNVPAGRMVGSDSELSIRVLGEFRRPEDVAGTVLRFNDMQSIGVGKTVRLSEIADVRDVAKEKRTYARVNGEDAVILEIQKSREGNAIEISNFAKTAIKEVESSYPVKLLKTNDSAVLVEESLFDLAFALVFGIILVTWIVHLFLHDWRGTIIVALAIPICLMATLMVLWALGFTLNSMSMLALSLAIGVLVDDAIVVLENIYRHLRMGEDAATAALNGRGEIGLAAIAITLVDVVVFLPLGFMGGVTGQFFKPLGIGFAVAVMLSLFVSFTVTPMLAARWYKEGENVEHKRSRFAIRFDNTFERIEKRYRKVLEWSLKHRWFTFNMGFAALFAVFIFIGGSFATNERAALATGQWLAILSFGLGVLAFLGSIFKRKVKPQHLLSGLLFGLLFPAAGFIGFQYAQWKQGDVFQFAFAPPSDAGLVQIRVETQAGTSLERTLESVKRIEAIAMKHPDVKFVQSTVGELTGGFGGGGGSRGTNLAVLTVRLHEKRSIMDQLQFWKTPEYKLRTRSDVLISGDLTSQIGKAPGTRTIVALPGGFGFGSPIQLSLRSDDRALLLATAQRVMERLEAGAVPGIHSADISSKPGKPEVRLVPDRDRLADADLSVGDLGAAMRMMYEGNDDVKMRVDGREYPVRVMMSLEDRNNSDMLSTVPVAFDRGTPILLPQVASITNETTVDKLDRRARQPEVLVTAEVFPGIAQGAAQSRVDAWLAESKILPEGVVVKPLGQTEVQQQETPFLMTTLLIGFVLVFMILASLYDNLLYPLIIQLAQPQAFVGALLALIITDKTLNIVGFIGLIALVGLVGKNAILLVDYANTLRARGYEREEALLESGPTRFRPIMMTTLALILGMLPVALAIGRGSEFRETLGIIIIGGIALSTLLTLLVIPCSYTIFDDLSETINRWRGKGPSGPPKSLDAPEESLVG